MRIEQCRQFHQLVQSHTAPIPVAKWGVTAAERAKLVSTDFQVPVTALDLEKELWSPSSTIV